MQIQIQIQIQIRDHSHYRLEKLNQKQKQKRKQHQQHQPPAIPAGVYKYIPTLSSEDEQLVDEFMDRTRAEFQGEAHNFGIFYDLGVPRGKNDFRFEYPHFRPRRALEEADPDEYVIQFLIHSGAFIINGSGK
ncbi:MAG: hypothetical protein EZS28_022707 [Streblomastix strix]|uniref:Uncharacterized protein n=1 Tax=Streblomastix strix TaxID=222440 RepID=A0A5J4VGP4_9EUKA|nr:MAG: hypothetical protein EZS28_022707 [Streblomastix strix]